MDVIKWVDMSSVGAYLGSFRDVNKTPGMAILDTQGRFHDAILKLGFRPANGLFEKGLYLKADTAITPKMLREAFGAESVQQLVDTPKNINEAFNSKVKELTKFNTNALFSQQRALGLNHLGDIVQESIIGRYVIRESDGKHDLIKEDESQPSVFLRAKTVEQLRDVAKGFSMRITLRNEVLRKDHIMRLMDVSNEGNFTERDYQEAIEHGLNAVFSEAVDALGGDADANRLAVFDIANKIYVGMPELKVRTPNSIANQQYSTPLPLAAIAQSMLGGREEMRGASLLDPTIGNMNLVAGINAGFDVEDQCRIYGVEIDPARAESVSGKIEQLILGDATNIDFKSAFNKPTGFDFVIANPPFGSMPSRQEVVLPAGSLMPTMTIQRQDQYILLNALHARSDFGRAVFITGADSHIEDGEIKGRSVHLLNYLYDHYEVIGVTDVSGELYKKQGAQFPLRLYVIGARRPVPVQSIVPEKMNVIRTYEGLREWAERVIGQQASVVFDVSALLGEPQVPTVSDVGKQYGIDIDQVKAVLATPAEVPAIPDGNILMNAPRPLLGQQVVENGEFLHGRFYALIDLADGDYAKGYFDRNVRDDARMVFVASKELQEKMALQTLRAEYVGRYQQMSDEERQDVLSPMIRKLQDQTYGELAQLAIKATSEHAAHLVKVDAQDEISPEVARTAALYSAATQFGSLQTGFVGVTRDERYFDDYPEPDSDLNKKMVEIFAENGAAFYVQIDESRNDPFRVLRAIYEDGRGVGSQWSATPEGAFEMVKDAPVIQRVAVAADSEPAEGFYTLRNGATVATRTVYLPDIKENGLKKLMSQQELTDNDIEKLKDYKWVLLFDDETSLDRGFKLHLIADGLPVVFKDKFLLTNINHKISAAGGDPYSLINNPLILADRDEPESQKEIGVQQDAVLGDIPDDLPEGLAKLIGKIRVQIEQIQSSGGKVVSRAEFMADVNNGNRTGFSVEALNNRLAGHEDLLEKLKAGRITPASVGGKGSSKKAAIAWLVDSIESDQLGIASGGFLYYTNLSNYNSTLQRIINHAVDDDYRSDAQIAEESAQKALDDKQRADADAELRRKAELVNKVEIGSWEKMASPLELKFSISKDAYWVLAELSEIDVVNDKVSYLMALAKGDFVKQKELQFNDRVNLSRAMADGTQFGYFNISPRVGYSVATAIVDLDAVPAAEIVANSVFDLDGTVVSVPSQMDVVKFVPNASARARFVSSFNGVVLEVQSTTTGSNRVRIVVDGEPFPNGRTRVLYTSDGTFSVVGKMNENGVMEALTQVQTGPVELATDAVDQRLRIGYVAVKAAWDDASAPNNDDGDYGRLLKGGHAVAKVLFKNEIPNPVSDVLQLVADTLQNGAQDDWSFEGFIRRYERVENKIAEQLELREIDANVRIENDPDSYRRKASQIASEEFKLRNGFYYGFVQFSERLFIHPSRRMTAAYLAYEDKINKVVEQLSNKASHLEQRARAELEIAMQEKFSPFAYHDLTMPTAASFGLSTINKLVLSEGFPGWSDGALIDFVQRPKMVADAIKKYHVDESGASIRHVNPQRIQEIKNNAYGCRLQVFPVADYVDQITRDAEPHTVFGVVFVDGDDQRAMWVNSRYVGYFEKTYADVAYFVEPGVDNQSLMMLVKSKGETVGLVMGIRPPEKTLERVLKVKYALTEVENVADVVADVETAGADVSGVKNAGDLTSNASQVADKERLASTIEWVKESFVKGGVTEADTMALAKYLVGDSSEFEGVVTDELRAGLSALGISGGDVGVGLVADVMAAIKSVYVHDMEEGRELAAKQKELMAERVVDADEEGVVDLRQESDYQQRYIAFSNVSEPDTMIPSNLSGAIYEALTAIKKEHGDIDTYVGKELDFSFEELAKYFKAEQVDALAMIFNANDRGRGFLLGDRMGVGKGRVLAGVARRERLQGRIPMFVTLTPSLFTDFLERDIVNIGSRDLFKNPMIVNDNCKTVDENGDVVVKAMNRNQYRLFAEKGELPAETDMILITYSQMSRTKTSSLTARYMNELCHRNPISLLLDESHNGAGTSNTSENLESMIESIGRKGNVVYSSGTAIKGAKNLRLYKKILPTGIDHDELLAAVESDPLSLQEALNYEIAAQGCMISRELDDTGIEKEYFVSKNIERNKVVANQVAEIFSAMSFLSGDVARIVGKMNREFQVMLEDVPESERDGSRMGASSLNFGSRLHELNRQFLLSIKTEDAVQLALKALDDNKKPIFTVQHTGESLLADYLSRANEVYSSADDVERDLKTVTLDKPISFKNLLEKYLEKISWIKIQGRYGDVSYRQAEGKKVADAVERIRLLIDALPDDLPLTPIDYIRDRLTEHGYSFAEVSGRNLQLSKLSNGKYTIEQVPGRADKTRINRAVRNFNNGEADVIVLTASGSTGMSLHASPAIGKDVRARVMIKLEVQPDIARERQMDGRHNRTGQIVMPEYWVPLSGLMADDRITMMFNNKNRSLSSSTVANRDSKDLVKDVPDLLNVVGDMAAGLILGQNPALAAALSIDMPDSDDVWSKPALWYCNVLSGRASMLSVEEQESLYATWQAKFVEELDRLKAMGINPLEVECADWKADLVSRKIFMGVESKEKSKSQFNSPIYLTTVGYDIEMKVVHSHDVDKEIKLNVEQNIGVVDKTRMPAIVKFLESNRDLLLSGVLSKRHSSVDVALADAKPNEVKNLNSKLIWMKENLPRLTNGAVFVDKNASDELVPHVVVSFTAPNSFDSYTRLSDFQMRTMRPGTDQFSTVTLSGLFSKDIAIERVPFSEHLVIRKRFDEAQNGIVRRTARLLDGNLFESTALNLREKLGRKIVYTDASGARQHGILISSVITEIDLMKLPEKLRDVDIVMQLLARGKNVTTDSKGEFDFASRGLFVKPIQEGRAYELSLHAAKVHGGDIYLDPVLSRIAGKEKSNQFDLNFSTKEARMVAVVQKHQIREVLSYLVKEKNINFYVSDREMLKKVRTEMENEHARCVEVA